MTKKRSTPSRRNPLVLTGREAEVVLATLEYAQDHADELEAKELRRQLELSKHLLSEYDGRKQSPLPGKRTR